jgi:hypothetical protein
MVCPRYVSNKFKILYEQLFNINFDFGLDLDLDQDLGCDLLSYCSKARVTLDESQQGKLLQACQT